MRAKLAMIPLEDAKEIPKASSPGPRIEEPLFENISSPPDILSTAMKATLFSNDPAFPEGDFSDMPVFETIQPVAPEILDQYIEEEENHRFNAELFAELEVPEPGQEIEIEE